MFKHLRTLKPYFWRYRWGFVLGGLTVICTNFIWAQFPRVLGHAMDDLGFDIRRALSWFPHEKEAPFVLVKVSDAYAKSSCCW